MENEFKLPSNQQDRIVCLTFIDAVRRILQAARDAYGWPLAHVITPEIVNGAHALLVDQYEWFNLNEQEMIALLRRYAILEVLYAGWGTTKRNVTRLIWQDKLHALAERETPEPLSPEEAVEIYEKSLERYRRVRLKKESEMSLKDTHIALITELQKRAGRNPLIITPSRSVREQAADIEAQITEKVQSLIPLNALGAEADRAETRLKGELKVAQASTSTAQQVLDVARNEREYIDGHMTRLEQTGRDLEAETSQLLTRLVSLVD